MTSVVTRWLSAKDQPVEARKGPAGRARGGLLLNGALAGVGAASAGLVVLAALIGLAWILEPAVGGSVLGPARLCAQAWLLGHGAEVSAAGIVVAITPLGLTVGLAACCWFAACWAGRRAEMDSLRGIAWMLAAMVTTYAAIGIALATVGSTAGAEIGLVSALPGIVGLSALVGAAGLLRTAGHGRLLHDVAPFPSRAVLAGVGAGSAVLLASGVGTLGVAIATDRAGFAALTETLAPGWSAGIGLLVLSLLLLPNAALYAVAMLVGPGFSVGAGTSVSAFGVNLGLVPGLPIVAALPDEPAVPIGAVVALTVPVLCGLLVGAVVARRLDEDVSATVSAGWAAAAALVLATALALAQWLASGSLGEEGLATIGAPARSTLVAAAVFLALPAALSGFLLRSRRTRLR